jgi:hypothetical protein
VRGNRGRASRAGRLGLPLIWVICVVLVGVGAGSFSRGAWAATPSAYASAVLADNPSLFWRYGEKDGTRIADASGHGRDGEYVVDNFVNAGVSLDVSGALANDSDTAFGHGTTYLYYGAAFARLSSAAGLPSGNAPRTVEGWTRFSGSVTLARWGGFAVYAQDRALTIDVGAGQRLAIPIDDRELNTGKWHHVAVSYNGSRFTGYVNGEPVGHVDAPAPLATETDGRLEAGVISSNANGYFDELAIYPTALDAATAARHFTASGNSKPTAPGDVHATASDSQPNRISVSWSAATGGAPPAEQGVEHYLITAYAGSAARATKAVSRGQTETALSGLLAGEYTVAVRAVNAFGIGSPATSATVAVAGATDSYAASA